MLAALLALPACGRKGPPLPPIVYVPAAVGDYSVKRQGNEVVLQFKLPSANTDSTSPASLRRVEVYAHTGPLPAATDFVRYGTLVQSLEVKPVEEDATGQQAESAAGLFEQGEIVRVEETLTDALKEPGALPPARTLAARGPVETLETPGTENFDAQVVRYYAVVPVAARRGRRGPFSGPTPVPFTPAQDPPSGLQVNYTESALQLTWSGSPGDSKPEETPPLEVLLLETPGTRNLISETDGTVELEERPPARPADALVKPPSLPPVTAVARFGYNVYDVTDSKPDQLPAPPLNAKLLTAPGYVDSTIAFGVERCFVVRRVEMAGAVAIESDPTPRTCVTPEDTFPPAAPKSLASVSADGAVDLIWEANAEPDLAGYVILRGEAPGEKLARLTPEPIAETRYRDTAVEVGRAYVYAVAAVDKAPAPNVSANSNEVTQVVR